MEPTPEDWLKVGNDVRRLMNDVLLSRGRPSVPLPTTATRVPTDEELAGYDSIAPGMSDMLREAARDEMNYRLRVEAVRRYALDAEDGVYCHNCGEDRKLSYVETYADSRALKCRTCGEEFQTGLRKGEE